MNSLDSKTFTIFHPVKKFYFNTDYFINGLMVVCLLPLLVEHAIFRNEDISIISFISYALFIMLLPVNIILQLIAKRRYQVLKGTLGGEVTFYNDRITINGQDFLLDDISELKIQLNDYYGMTSKTSTANGRRLHGVDNRAIISMNNGKTYICNFQRKNDLDYKQMAGIFTGYHKAGKFHWFELLTLLKLSDYDEIQAFKKQL